MLTFLHSYNLLLSSISTTIQLLYPSKSIYMYVQASLMKHAKKRLAEMREQASDFISETVLHDPPKLIRTDDADESQSVSSNHLDIPRCSSPNLRRQSRNSVYSIKSIDINDDAVVGCRNYSV